MIEVVNKKKERIVYVDLLETIAIICVVFYHGAIGNANIFNGKMISYINYFIHTIIAVIIPMFFLINGFLLFGKEFNLFKHLKKTIHIIAISVIWGVITIVLLMIIRGETLGLKEFFLTFWQTRPNWTSHLWYLGEFVCIYLVFPLLYYIRRDQQKIFVYFIVIGIVIIFGNTFINELGMIATVIIRHPQNISNINFFNMFNPFTENNVCDVIYFCLGGLIYTYKDKFEKLNGWKWKILMLVGFIFNNVCLFIIGILYSKITGMFWDTGWEGANTIFVLFNVVYLFVFFMNFNRNNKSQTRLKADKNSRFYKWIELISKNTMGIYLIHVLVLRTIEKFSIQTFLTSNILFAVIYSIIVMLISLEITLWIKKVPVLGKFI